MTADPATTTPSTAEHALAIDQLRSTRRTALAVDIAAVLASLAANIAAAPRSVGGWLVAAVAPIGLFLAIILWHRSHGVLAGWPARAFNLGLAGIAAGAAWISFGHLRLVAKRFGQSPEAAAVIPLVIDGAAVLATIVVVAAGQQITELELAAATAERETRAIERRERAAQLEAERTERAERAARRARLAEAGTPAATTTNGRRTNGSSDATRPSNDPKHGIAGGARRGASKPATGQLIADYLAEHPQATQAEVATAAGCSPKTVQRSQAWRDHQAERQEATTTTTTEVTA